MVCSISKLSVPVKVISSSGSKSYSVATCPAMPPTLVSASTIPLLTHRVTFPCWKLVVSYLASGSSSSAVLSAPGSPGFTSPLLADSSEVSSTEIPSYRNRSSLISLISLRRTLACADRASIFSLVLSVALSRISASCPRLSTAPSRLLLKASRLLLIPPVRSVDAFVMVFKCFDALSPNFLSAVL